MTDVALQLLAEADRPLYRGLWTSPHVMQAIGPPLTDAQADAQFDRTLRHNAYTGPGHRAWSIRWLAEGEAVGLIALRRYGARAELGFMSLPKAWRRGVTSGAISLLLPYAFDTLGLEGIDVSRRDDAQARVLHRLLLPHGFSPASGLRPGETGWSLSSRHWANSGPRRA